MINNLLATLFENIGEIFSEVKYLELILEGFEITLKISIGAAIIGLILGTLVAIIKIATETGKGNKWLKIPNAVCEIYVTVVRGTPMALQLFLMSFVVFAIRGFPQLVVAIIAFGINSGAYVSENIRAGIMSVDKGQTEAGRALGLSSSRTLVGIVIPQGVKNVIPAIGNELIALVKETSIVSMIGMIDLTQASKIIGSGQNLASYLAPMLVVAMCYLAIVYFLTFIIKVIERRLRKSDKR
ncbi:MAG: amino acid ABC transporter permease [Clostridiales bacterium]|nr:amino acid ABC transporter permease [Clostridiales bacterium]